MQSSSRSRFAGLIVESDSLNPVEITDYLNMTPDLSWWEASSVPEYLPARSYLRYGWVACEIGGFWDSINEILDALRLRLKGTDENLIALSKLGQAAFELAVWWDWKQEFEGDNDEAGEYWPVMGEFDHGHIEWMARLTASLSIAGFPMRELRLKERDSAFIP